MHNKKSYELYDTSKIQLTYMPSVKKCWQRDWQ